MDSFNFHDIRVEKANAISRFRRFQKITTLFRFVELFVFLIILSRFSTQFAFSFKLSSENFRGVSVTLLSPRFVFVLGNVIVIVLFLISGRFSANKGEKNTDLYDEYVEKYRKNQQTCSKEEKKTSDAYKHRVCYYEKKIQRSQSENVVRAVHSVESRGDLRRSMSQKCRNSATNGMKAAAAAADTSSPYREDEMSNEEFRRTVEAFIARQQRLLREEEESSAVVSFESSAVVSFET